MLELLRNLFSSYGFHPHGMCYLWEPALLWLHGASDFLIGLSYASISVTLAYMVRRIRLPFHFMFLAFGLFIGACGVTHFMEIYTLQVPVYWLSGLIKAITALASITTAIMLIPLLPKTSALVNSANLSEERRVKLETANNELSTLYEKVKEMDELKTQFFANISHELRTPLTLIMGPVNRLLTSNQLSDRERKDLELIQRNTNILLKQVNDLLDVSRLEAGKMEVNYVEIDLARLVRVTSSHFDALAQDQQINFKVETNESLYTEADPEKLQRVLLNLLSNAFKFTPPKGEIHCRLYTEDTVAVIEVKDTGPGVPVEMREIIFERFRQADSGATRRFGGTGLGLAIVKEFVELHRGTIKVGGRPGEGAIFTIRLPLTKKTQSRTLDRYDSTVSMDIAKQSIEELKAIHADLRVQEDSYASKNSSINIEQESPLVLIIEDNKDMNRFLAETLAIKYRVATAYDGRAGLEKAFTLNPDLILCDVMMPNISGDQLVHQIRRNTSLDDVPIIILTAKADDQLRIKLLQEGAQDYLMKPFLPEEMLIRVGNLIEIKLAREVLQESLSTSHENIAELAGDIALRKRDLQDALNRLRESEEWSRLIVEEVKDYAIFALDSKGKVISWNSGAERIKGYKAEEIIGQHFSIFFGNEEAKSGKPDKQLKVAMAEGKIEEEGLRLRKDGSLFWANVTITTLKNDKGGVKGFSVIARDITEQKRIEEERAQLLIKEREARLLAEEASSAKDEFLATVSHELRTPLTAILGWTRMLNAGLLDQQNTARALETIERNAQLQSKIVEDILDVSRIITGKLRIEPSKQEIAPIIESAIEVIRPTAEAKNVQIEYTLGAIDGPVWGDPTRLQQIVWNLLSNAVKFTPNGGQVTIKLHQVKDRAEIIIKDTGEGITADFLPFVFDRFRQANSKITRIHGGLGLGLALVRHLVELHGGTIKAESEGINKGATFTVQLPIMVEIDVEKSRKEKIAENSEAKRREEIEAVPNLNRMRILIVEDDADTKDMLATILKEFGAEVESTNSVAEALESFSRWDFDMLISDIGLPDEDGYSLIEKIRNSGSNKSRIPAIALTAYARAEDKTKAISAGYQLHLAKPINLTELITAISTIAKQSKQQAM
jgi:PAS domain S-box-containing protein